MEIPRPPNLPQGSRKEQLLATLGKLNIDPRIEHYTPYPRENLGQGIFCKNLLLKDRKGQFYLVTFHEDKVLDLKWLRKELNAYRNFSFASQQELYSLLGVESGSVTPFGLLFDKENKVKFVLDTELLKSQEWLNFHPFEANETCLVTFEQLQEFCNFVSKDIISVDC